MKDSGQPRFTVGQANPILAAVQPFLAWPIDYCPSRVVSLVPSITDSLIQFGLADSLVGITTYCPTPKGNSLTRRVGGPANLKVEQIIHLSPDLVIAGLEENHPKQLIEIEEAGLPLWVVFPQTVNESLSFLYQLAEGFRSQLAFQMVRSLEVSVTYLRSSTQANPVKMRYFCPVWHEKLEDQDVWMVFDNQTYAADLLSLFGAENCFGKGKTKADDLGEPLSEGDLSGGDPRYYRISTEQVIAANPDIILLPSEPYPFDQRYLGYLQRVFSEVSAIQRGKIHFVNGQLIFWYGTRLGQALQELPSYFY
ncbi:MAG: ABC transporter substrate-binding protein [Anaerolineales bacterium]